MKNQKGFAVLEILLILFILITVFSTGIYVYKVKTNSNLSLNNASKVQAAISPNRTVINASSGSIRESSYRTSYSQLPATLQTAITTELKKEVPLCINEKGQIVSQLDRTQPLDPEVIYDASGFAQTTIGCGDGAAGIFAKVNGTWKFLAKTQMAYSCDLLKKYRFPSSLLALNNPAVICLDKNNNESSYSE